MHTLIAIASVLVAIMLFTSWIASRPRGFQLQALANVGEGFFPGKKTYKASAAITERYLLGEIGADAEHIVVAGAADQPIGVITDEAAAAEDLLNVNLLGSTRETQIVVASAAIAAGAFVMPAASGRVQTLSASAGTYYVVGRALNAAAAAGDLVQIDPIPCIKTVV